MESFFLLLGQKGVITVIGIVSFLWVYKYSVNLFQWIEDQTYGTKNYISKKFEFLHLKVEDDHITYGLLFASFGLATLVFGFIALLGNFLAAFILAFIAFILGWKLPKPIVDHLVAKRIEAYQNQMVDALNLLSNGLRAGLSVPQSLAMVVDELPAPISQEFGMILQQNKIGSPLEECFSELAIRVPTEDNDMFVTAINILRETGGNLAETFDTITAVIRERVRLKQKIDTYTAQGMMQGMVIACMPTAMGLIFYISDPPSMVPLFTTVVGYIFLVVALMFNIAGVVVILKIVKIKV